MDDFEARLSFKEALQLYLFLQPREGELSGGPDRIQAQLRGFLYDRLSIEEMEDPAALMARLDAQRT